ncbi:hypothetical protein ACQWF4_22865, partial [Salmonella enterica subsp. enterica serovar Infantis]
AQILNCQIPKDNKIVKSKNKQENPTNNPRDINTQIKNKVKFINEKKDTIQKHIKEPRYSGFHNKLRTIHQAAKTVDKHCTNP